MSRRVLVPVVLFALIAVWVAGGLAWVTVAALRVEQAERLATARADRLNQVRLALWRLDGHLLPVLALEGNRPAAHYTPTASDSALSPLLTADLPAWMVLHVHLDPGTGWRSPQVLPPVVLERQRTMTPSAAWLTLASERQRRLDALNQHLPPAVIFGQLQRAEPSTLEPSRPAREPSPPPQPDPAAATTPETVSASAGEQALRYQLSQRLRNTVNQYEGVLDAAESLEKRANEGAVVAGAARSAPTRRDAQHLDAPAPTRSADRREMLQSRGLAGSAPAVGAETFKAAEAVPLAAPMAAPALAAAPAPAVAPGVGFLAEPAPAPEPPVRLGPLLPHWLTAVDGHVHLLLLRTVTTGAGTAYQGVWLDWPRLHESLLPLVRDFFPEATLHPLRPPASAPSEAAMTALPAWLDPGPGPPLPPAGWTPLRVGLALAWVGCGVALAAVAAGGLALLHLSERRMRFVSAVTHELRTPLTSLRLYLDMLVSGLITDPAQREEYLATLAQESDRLQRLVENVLDFAKLERRAVQTHIKAVPVADLVEEAARTWGDRLAADGKKLVVVTVVPPTQAVRTDPRIVTQILGNLLDNARKYSKEAADPRVWLWAKPAERGRVAFEVEDRGPGIPARDRRGLFRPFRRGSTADTLAGGAGLGLALAQHWANWLGGRLSYRPAEGGHGACFRLELPAADSPTRPSPPPALC